MVKQIVLVGLGGGIGSILRFLTSLWINKYVISGFPLGTFVVNLAGCFFIGLLTGLSFRFGWLDRDIRLLLITGFCGGYTTFSAFSFENLEFLESGNYTLFALYAAGSILMGVAAVWLGIFLTRLG